MTGLQFEEFFQALHGYDPFPWQSRLWKTVSRDGWPDVIAVPTSAGKTACMDVALFHLVTQAGSPERSAPLRIFHVIDRRVVVDEAYERARLIEKKLSAALKGPPGVLKEAAERLVEISGGAPLKASVLRGGVYREDSWVGSPNQPLIAATTVDQIGSRLLFRGYGLSPNQAPIHAGLVGNDSLFLVDEAHLSMPFTDTLDYLKKYREWGESPIRNPWGFVRLSATPAEEGYIFREDKKDYANETLKRRFNAVKSACLSVVDCETVKKDASKEYKRRVEKESRRALVKSITEHAEAVAAKKNVHVVGIVVNRVATARKVYEELCGKENGEVFLLTGRVRPFDRDRLLEELLPRIGVGRVRGEDDSETLFIIATQCIEVGANLDFDALVTECASLDALRQRFGRLDRLGTIGHSFAVIVARSDQVARNSPDDPVYGGAIKETWKWLKSNAEKKKIEGEKADSQLVIDFGINAMTAILPNETEAVLPMLPPRKYAPVMLPAHLDLWVQTHPIPSADPDPAFWLHGPETGPADCHIVWRADLDPNADEKWRDILILNPPSSAEALPVPLYAARTWLAHMGSMDFGDQEGQAYNSWRPEREKSARKALVWRGPEESKLLSGDELRAGDTLVVPSSYGGLDRFGWKPDSTLPVTDIGDPVAWQQRGRPILRLHPKVVASWTKESAAVDSGSGFLFSSLDLTGADVETIAGGLREWAASHNELPAWVVSLIEAFARDPWRVTPYPDESGHVALTGRRRIRRKFSSQLDDDITTQDDTSSFTNPVSLEQHSTAVQNRCELLARRCGLPSPLSGDVSLAGMMHDVGKSYPPFQLMLFGGDEVAEAAADEPLAKSGFTYLHADSYRRARERAGLPQGWRHELLSVVLAESNGSATGRGSDPDLVLHLIASHHGRCRPFAPFAKQDKPELVEASFMGMNLSAWSEHGLERLDSGVIDRFWSLVQRYGWYGLAYLEAMVRLADQQVSAEDELQPAGGETT